MLSVADVLEYESLPEHIQKVIAEVKLNAYHEGYTQGWKEAKVDVTEDRYDEGYKNGWKDGYENSYTKVIFADYDLGKNSVI